MTTPAARPVSERSNPLRVSLTICNDDSRMRAVYGAAYMAPAAHGEYVHFNAYDSREGELLAEIEALRARIASLEARNASLEKERDSYVSTKEFCIRELTDESVWRWPDLMCVAVKRVIVAIKEGA